MKEILLKEGDVIKLENGMTIYTKIPEMFVYANRKTSKKLTESDVIIGKTYSNKTNIIDNVSNAIEAITESFNSEGFNLSRKDARKFVLNKIKTVGKKKFTVDEGKFVVTKTLYEGGGTGMGPHDIYPDGHRIYCKKLKNDKFDEDGTEVNFYQNGCITAVISNIKVIRTMKMKFV